MTKSVYQNANRINLSGCLTKDAFTSASVTRFRVAHNTGKDRPAVFMDCVMFPNEKRTVPSEILKKGCKVIITGHLHVNERTSEDGRKYQNIEIVVDTVAENVAKEVEVEDPVSVTLTEESEDLPEDE